jgi:hypothetical protein
MPSQYVTHACGDAVDDRVVHQAAWNVHGAV